MSPVRSLLRIALVGCLVLSTQGLLLVQGTFLLRQDFVVENLCISLTPECDGKCFLSKQLREQREREQERGAASLEVMLAVGSLVAASESLPDPPVRPSAFGQWTERAPHQLSPAEVFRPPRA